MPDWSILIPHFTFHTASRLPLYLVAGAASVGTLSVLLSRSGSIESGRPKSIPSPKDTVLGRLSGSEAQRLPYPPDALPGARDVDSAYGSTRIYEWGPEEGDRVLLIHGISTPSIALGGLAHKLVQKGCRVMLFDLFGRGYSSGPSPETHHYDSALYTAQILLCLQSSPLAWKDFTLIGYSLGGALSADFTSYFPDSITSLILIAPGGLIRTNHITWKSRLLYTTSGLIPESLIHHLVGRRLWTGPEVARSIEPEPDRSIVITEKQKDAREGKDRDQGGLRTSAVYQSSNTQLLPSNPNSTVSKVVDWQIKHHAGFVPAFISSIRYAPIHGEHERWRILGQNITNRRGPLRKVHVVLGEMDPIIVAGEVVGDIKEVVGEENVDVRTLKGVGHEVAIERTEEIAGLVGEILGR